MHYGICKFIQWHGMSNMLKLIPIEGLLTFVLTSRHIANGKAIWFVTQHILVWHCCWVEPTKSISRRRFRLNKEGDNCIVGWGTQVQSCKATNCFSTKSIHIPRTVFHFKLWCFHSRNKKSDSVIFRFLSFIHVMIKKKRTPKRFPT
jgi:hypothetical protein